MSKEELVKLLKDNFTNEYGDIEISGLNLDGDLIIEDCKAHNIRIYNNKVFYGMYVDNNEVSKYMSVWERKNE